MSTDIVSDADLLTNPAPEQYPADEGYFDGKTFIPARVGRTLEERGLHIRVGPARSLWAYQNGVYRPNGEDVVRAYIRKELANSWRINRRNEVLGWCSDNLPTIPDRPNPDILNVANGLLDWRTGDIYAHSPDEPSIVQIPHAWNATATCPTIDKFLSEVLPDDARDLFYEIVGYALLADQPMRKAILLHGRGRNGKSTALDIVAALIGSDNLAAVPLQTLTESPFAAADLFGKLANIVGDLDARSIKRSDTFKTITGGNDRIRAERKFGHPFFYVPFATLIFSANELPESSDQTDAWFDRFIVIPFPNRFSDGEIIPNLSKQLTSNPQEMEGFLFRAVQGLQQLMRRGYFDLPQSTQQAGTEYREQLDTARTFVMERCVVSSDMCVTRTDLYRSYREWCIENGRLPVSAKHFTIRLREYLKEEIEETTVNRVRGWQGIGFALSWLGV